MDFSNQYGTLEIQKELLQMMKDVHVYLVDSNIRYSLAGGSLLGAIRHSGFIPWDDDVDIMMDRENFDKFIKMKFDLCGYCLERVLWIYRIRKDGHQESDNLPTIDVFVNDRTPDNAILRKLKVLLVRFVQGMMHKNIQYSNYSLLYKTCLAVTHLMGCVFSDNFKHRIYDWVSQLWVDKNSKFVSSYNDLFRLVSVCYNGNLMQNIVMKRFEDVNFCITSEYDNYLSSQYGDYMTPPPESDRIPLHLKNN